MTEPGTTPACLLRWGLLLLAVSAPLDLPLITLTMNPLPPIPLSIPRIVALLLAIIALILMITGSIRPRMDKLGKLLLLFLFSSTISALLSESRGHSFATLFNLYAFFGFYVLIATIAAARMSVAGALETLIAGGLLAAILGILQYSDVTEFGLSHLYDPPRASGFSGNPNEYGLFLLCLLPLVFHLYFAQRAPRRRAFLAVAFFIVGAGTMMSMSRAVLVGLVPAIVIPAIRRIRRRESWIALGAVVLLIVLFPLHSGARLGADSLAGGIEIRRLLARDGVSLFAKHPLMGSGPGTIEEHSYGGRATHNSYIQLLAEHGLVGASLFGLIIVMTFANIRHATRRAGLRSGGGETTAPEALLALPYVMMAYMIVIAFHSFLYDKILWSCFALSSASRVRVDNRQQRADGSVPG